MVKTLAQAVETDAQLPAESKDRVTNAFTRTQKDALTQGLLAQYVETLGADAAHGWIRQPLPLR